MRKSFIAIIGLSCIALAACDPEAAPPKNKRLVCDMGNGQKYVSPWAAHVTAHTDNKGGDIGGIEFVEIRGSNFWCNVELKKD